MNISSSSYPTGKPERLKSCLIPESYTVKQTLKHMNHFGNKTVFVTDNAGRLKGAVTDGDIRRWIIKHNDFKRPVSSVMNKDPVFFPEGTAEELIRQKMLRHQIDSIPMLAPDSSVSGVYIWTDLFGKEKQCAAKLDMPVVVMAGGEGRRLGAITRVLPKPLLPIGETPILDHIMGRFRRYGCRDFFISLNYKASLVKAYLKDNAVPGDRISFVEEKKPLGTAGSLHYLKGRLRSPFFVINCDVLIDADYADIAAFHGKQRNDITLVASIKHHTIPYGICHIGKGGRLRSMTEKPEYDMLVNTGMYVLEPSVLCDIPSGSFFHITDLIDRRLKKRARIGVYPVSSKDWLDTGQVNELHSTLERLGTAQ